MMLDRMEGNAELKTSVQQMLATRRLTHSVLLVGEAGLGTGFAARCIAADYLYPAGGAAAEALLRGECCRAVAKAGKRDSGTVEILFTLAERFLFAVLLIFFFGMEKTVDFCGNHFDIVTDGDAFVILFQRIIVDDGTYQCDVFDTVSVMVCLERGQVEPTAESRVYDYNIGSVQMYKVLQCFR